MAGTDIWLIDLFSFLSCFDLAHSPRLLLEPAASGSQKQLLALHGKDQDRLLVVISTIMRLSPTIFLADSFG